MIKINAASVFFDDDGEADFSAFIGGKAFVATAAFAAAANGAAVFRYARFYDLGVEMSAKWAFHRVWWFSLCGFCLVARSVLVRW